uniref:apolipoprotein B-100-like n=1 Tax=Myxine glutinosa TaxID=7769 RepID=UPI00358DE0B7
MDRLKPYLLLALLALAHPVLIEAGQECSREMSLFKPLKEYTYNYELKANGGQLSTTQHSSFKLTCKVNLEVPDRCSFLLKLKECEVFDLLPTGEELQFQTIPEQKAFVESLMSFDLPFRTERGMISEVYGDPGESITSLNVKRGIISALMGPVPSMADGHIDMPTIHGLCPTSIHFDDSIEDNYNVHVQRDLEACQHSASAMESVNPFAVFIQEYSWKNYMFNSSQNCNYNVLRNNRVITAECQEKYYFSQSMEANQLVLTQTLNFEKTQKSNKRGFDYTNLHDRGLNMEFSFPEKIDEVPQKTLETLEQIVENAKSGDDQERAKLFLQYVKNLRTLSDTTLANTLPDLLKKSTSITIQALAQCGSAACFSGISSWTRSGKTGRPMAAMLSMLLALHPQPCEKMLHEALRMAQEQPSRVTIMALSMVAYKHYHYSSDRRSKELSEAASFITSRLGNDCSRGGDYTYLALKAAGNMGDVLQAAGSQGPAAVLACAANVRLPLTMRQAAVQSLRRMQLTDEMRQVLLDTYSDWKTSVELRLTSYLALMRRPTNEDLQKILFPLPQEPNGQIKSFVASHIANILDTDDLATKGFKSQIEEVLGGQAIPSAMDSRKFSRNYKLFKTIDIPGLKRPLWGQIESNVIFDPSSYLPRSVMLDTTLNLLGENVDLFEIGLDGKGFEAPLEALFGPEGFFPTMKAYLMTDGKLSKEANDVLKRWLGVKSNGNPKSSDISQDLMKNLQKLVADVNMHHDDMDAAAYLRILGTEFGYLKLNDIQELPAAFSAIGKQLVALFPKLISAMPGGIEGEMFMHLLFDERDQYVSNVAGLPLRITTSGSVAAGAHYRAQIDATKFGTQKSFLSGLKLKPSMNAFTEMSMAVEIPKLARSGVKMVASLSSEFGSEAQVKLMNSELKLSILPSQRSTNLLKARIRSFILTREIQMEVEGVGKDVLCNNIIPGLKVCVTAEGDSIYTSAMSYSLESTDGIREYSLSASLKDLPASESGGVALKLALQTDGSLGLKEVSTEAICNWNEGRLEWNFNTPNCASCLQATLQIQDESDLSQDRQGYSISFNTSLQKESQSSLLGRYWRTSSSDILQGLIEIPRLGIYGTSRAVTNFMGDEYSLRYQGRLSAAYTSIKANYDIELDGDKLEARWSEDVRVKVHQLLRALVPRNSWNTLKSYSKEMGQMINGMLEQRMAQTDMTIRHIVSKSLEAADIGLQNTGYKDVLRHLRSIYQKMADGKNIFVLPSLSLPKELFSTSNGGMSYKFNKDSWFLTVPLPMGGRTTSTIRLLPMTLRTPALNYPSLSMKIPSRTLTLPPVVLPYFGKVDTIRGVRIPNSHTLRLPLFGALSMKYNLKNNLYDWNFDAEFGNKTTGDEKVVFEAKVGSNSSSFILALSHMLSSNIKMSHTSWKVLELQTGISYTSPLIGINGKFESATDLSRGFSSRLQGLAGVEIVHGMANTSFTATVEARDGRASFLHNIETKSTLLNKFYNNFNHTISGSYDKEYYGSEIKTTMVIDSSFGKFVNEWQALLSNRGLTISDVAFGDGLSFLLNSKLNLALNSAEIKGSVNSKVRRGSDLITYKAQLRSDNDVFLLNEELKGSFLEMFFNHSAGFMSDAEKINLYSMYSITNGISRENYPSKLDFNNKINITYTLSALEFLFVERGGYNEHELSNTLSGSFNGTDLIFITETFLNKASHKGKLTMNIYSLNGRSKTKINYPGLSFENNIEGSASLSGVSFTSYMNGTIGNQNHSLDVMLVSDGFVLKTMSAGKFENNELSHSNELQVRMFEIKLESKTAGDVYGSQISNDVNVNIGFPRQTFFAHSNWKFEDKEITNVAKLNTSSLKLNFDNDFTSRFSGNELKQKFEVLYADMAGHFRVSTNGSLYGGNIKKKLNMEFAGLSGKLESSTKFDSEPLEFSNTIHSSVRPFAVNLEMTTDGKMKVSLFGEHSGEMYSNILLQAKPFVYTLKHAYTGSSRHTCLSGKEYSTELQHNLDNLFNLREQMVKWDLRSELNNNRYTQQVYLANNENSITLKTQNNASLDVNLLDITIKVPSINIPVLEINRPAQYYNLLEILSIKPRLTKDLQDFNLSASLNYDKNKDVHLINIPFMENLPLYFHRLKVSTIMVLESVREMLSAENIDEYVQKFERMLNNVPQKLNEIVQNMDFERRMKYAQMQVLHVIKNYNPGSLSVNDTIDLIERISKLHVMRLFDAMERVRSFIIDFIRTYSLDDFIDGFLSDMIGQMKIFNDKYGILSGINEFIEKLKMFIKQYDADLAKKYMMNEAGIIANWMYEFLDKLQTLTREKDLKEVITCAIYFVQDFNVDNAIQYLKDILHSMKFRQAIQIIRDWIVDTFRYYKVQEHAIEAKKMVFQMMNEYKIPEKMNTLVTSVKNAVERYDVKERVRRLAEDLKYSKLNDVILSCTSFIDDLLKMLKRMHYQDFLDKIHDVVNSAIMYLQDFDYNQFVEEMNAWIKEKTDIINEYLQKNEIPMMLRDKAKEVGEKLKVLREVSLDDIEDYFIRMVVRLLRETHLDYPMYRIRDALTYIEYEISNIDLHKEINGILKSITAVAARTMTTVSEFDFSESVVAALDDLKVFASKYDLQDIVEKIRNFLEKGITTPEVQILSYTIPSFEISLGALRELKIPTEFDTPAFTVPFTDLHVRSFHLDLKTFSGMDIPSTFYTPEFAVLGYFDVPGIKIDFLLIKRLMLAIFDVFHSIRRPSDLIGLPTVGTSYIKPFNIPILSWKMENIDFPDLKFPEFTVPSLRDFDFPKLEIPNINLPKIPNTVTLPAVGKLNAELKVVTPLYNLQVSAGVHNKTANPGSPVILSFLNAEAKSDIDWLAFQMVADLQLSSPRMQYLEIETNVKLTQALGSIFHKGSVNLTAARVVAHAINTIAANTNTYKAELSNSALLQIHRSIFLNSTTSYRHDLTFPSLDANMNFDNKIMASVFASGIKVDIYNDATMKGHANERSYEGKHANHLHTSILGSTFLVKAKVNDVNKLGSINHEMKFKIVPYSMDFRHNGENSINVLGRSTVNTTVKVKPFTLEVNMNHTAEGVKNIRGQIYEALHLKATPSEIDLNGYSHCDGKLYLPFQLPVKINFHNDYALTLNSTLQRATWDMSSAFNRYNFGHNITFSNDADKVRGSFSTQSTFNLDFLKRKIDIPAMSIPYTERMTPKVENLVIWDKLNLEWLIKTPQQIVNLTMKIQYDKNKDWHAYDILLPEILQNSIDIYRENTVKYLKGVRSKSLRWMRKSYDSVRSTYDDLSSDTMVADDVPRLMLPTFTIPILNVQVSSYTLDLPDVSFLVSRQYKTPRFNVPVIGYRVPSYKLVLPAIEMPDFNLPKWRKFLTLPDFNILELPQTLYLPAFGNLIYIASFSSTPLSVTINSAITNGSNIIAHVQMHSVGPEFLNMQLKGRSSLSQKVNSIKLANTFSYEHYFGNMKHDSSIKMNKEGIDISLNSHGVFETEPVKFAIGQNVHSNSKMKPLLQMKHHASLKWARILVFMDEDLLPTFDGDLGHNITVEALWPTFSIDSHFKSVGQSSKDLEGSLSGKLENTAHVHLNKHGLRSSIHNELGSNGSFQQRLNWNISSKEEFDLELSPLRLYAVLKHNSQNKQQINTKFYGSGQNNMEGKLEFKSTPQELSASLKASIQQPNSLCQNVHFHEVISFILNPQNQSIKWNGNGQISSGSYLHEARIANKERKLTYNFDAFLEGHAAFLKNVILPLYGKSLWDVLKMDTTTTEQDFQRIKLSSALEYLKNPDGFLLQPPQLEATNGRKISFPAVTLYIPECIKHLPEKIRQGLRLIPSIVWVEDVDGTPAVNIRIPLVNIHFGPYFIDVWNFEFPEHFTTPEIAIPFTNVIVESYTVKLNEIEFPTRFTTTEFRIPFSDLIVPSYTIDLKNIHIPDVIVLPAFSTSFLNFPEIHFPELEITMNYIAMKEYAVPYFSLSIPAFKINIGRFDWSFWNILNFDFIRGYDIEKPIISFPAIDIDVPAFKLALPAAIRLPSFGSLSGSFNISSPVYNLTLSSSMENGTFAKKEAQVIFITDASTISTLRFLEFDLDVKSIIDSKSGDILFETESNVAHPDFSVKFEHFSRFPATYLSSGTCRVILDVESPSFTNLNVRMDQDSQKVEMSVSTPATGLIGFLVEKTTPPRIEIYTKEKDAVEKIVLMDAEVSLDDPEAMNVLSTWKIGTMDDAVAGTRVYALRAFKNLYQVINKYHKEHLDMELQEVENRLRQNIMVFLDTLQANWVNMRKDVHIWLNGVAKLLEVKLEHFKQKLPAMINRLRSNMQSTMENVTNKIRETMLESTHLINEYDYYLFEFPVELQELLIEWLQDMRIKLPASDKFYTADELYDLMEKRIATVYKNLTKNAGRLQRKTIKAINQVQLSLPFTESTIKGKDALIKLALWKEEFDNTISEFDIEQFSLTIENLVKSAIMQILMLEKAVLNFEYSIKLQELVQDLYDPELLILAQDMATTFKWKCIRLMDSIGIFLQQFKEEYVRASEMLRAFCKEHFESTALSWKIKYWEVENQIVQLIRMILPYKEEMGLKYYKEIVSIVSNMTSELSDIIKEDDPEKLVAMISEIRNKIKRNVFRLTNTAQAKLQQMYSTADEASRIAHRRIQKTYDVFVDTFDELLEEGKTISKMSRNKYNLFARKFKQFLQDLYLSIVHTVEMITEHENASGRFAVRIPYPLTLESFNELPQLGNKILQEVRETVVNEKRYLDKQLKMMHVAINRNLDYAHHEVEVIWKLMPDILSYCCKNLNETLRDIVHRVHSNAAEFQMTISKMMEWSAKARDTLKCLSILHLVNPRSYASALCHFLDMLPPFTATGMLFGDGKYLVTFDGRVHEVPEISDGCAYLLAHDFLDQNVTIILSKNAVIVRQPGIAVYLFSSGIVSLDAAGERQVQLPYTVNMHGMKILQHDSHVYVETSTGLEVVVNTKHKSFVFRLNGFYHGRSRGLLGVNNNDPVDDMKTSVGDNAKDIGQFFGAWELTGLDECAASSVAQSSHRSLSSPRCKDLLDITNQTSPYKSCFDVINPTEFLRLCQKSNDYCAFSYAYVTLCREKQIHFYGVDDCCKSYKDVGSIYVC